MFEGQEECDGGMRTAHRVGHPRRRLRAPVREAAHPRDPGLRFWAITHGAMMLVALVAVRAGRVFAMGEKSSAARRYGRCFCFAIALLAIVAGVPWPGLTNGRPLFRF